MRRSEQIPINLIELRERTLGNQPLMTDLLRLFSEHASMIFARARTNLDSGDIADACRYIHLLKGSASTIAAGELVRQFTAVEAALRADNIHAVNAAMPAIQAELDACLQQIATLAAKSN